MSEAEAIYKSVEAIATAGGFVGCCWAVAWLLRGS